MGKNSLNVSLGAGIEFERQREDGSGEARSNFSFEENKMAETITYGRTPHEEPDGYFRINGKDATETSYHIVFNSQLSLEFVPTKNADKITAVRVEVWKDNVLKNTVTLSQSGSTYTATYNLPSHGTYVLKGKIEWTEGSAIPKMNIFVSWGEDEDGDGDNYDVNQILGVGFIIAGGAILLTEKKR